MSQHGGVSSSPRGVAAGAGVGGGQEDALGVIFFELMKKLPLMSSLVFCLTLRLNLNSICLVFVDSETPSDGL